MSVNKPDWLRATPFGFANMALIFGIGILLLVFVMLNKLSPENWIWSAIIGAISTTVTGRLLKLNDCPTCGKSPFRYGRGGANGDLNAFTKRGPTVNVLSAATVWIK